MGKWGVKIGMTAKLWRARSLLKYYLSAKHAPSHCA